MNVYKAKKAIVGQWDFHTMVIDEPVDDSIKRVRDSLIKTLCSSSYMVFNKDSTFKAKLGEETSDGVYTLQDNAEKLVIKEKKFEDYYNILELDKSKFTIQTYTDNGYKAFIYLIKEKKVK